MHAQEEIPSLLRDPNFILELLPIVDTERTKVVLPVG